MMKKITSILLLLLAFSFGYGQTMLAQFDFESPGGYTTSIPEFVTIVNVNNNDYFIRTDGSDIINEDFLNIQGSYYFTTQDTDGQGATIPVFLNIDDINISGYTNLEFRVHLAEDDDGTNEDWDNLDYVHFNYDIDNSGSFVELLWIEGSGGPNTEPLLDTDFNGVGDGTAITNTFSQFTQIISGTGSLIDIQVEFRLNGGEEDIAIDNIEIWGTLAPCNPAVTWDGTTWSNGGIGPDIFTSAVISGDYDTSLDGGSFSACSLVVTNDSNLVIRDNSFVEVQNDISVDALSSIALQPQGAIIQNNDFAVITNNGTMTVDKLTAPMDTSDEYTYWSSPVSGETLIGSIVDLNPNRCYIFNGQNFLDATAETGNNNAAIPGQDDIDDDDDDWFQIGGSTPMQPGIGYATTISDLAYAIAPGVSNKQFRFTFEGDFNTGVYSIPIYRNDSEMNDFNWNFIGNPYPSAISADLFLAANSNIATNVSGTTSGGSSYINGAIFIWSQNTPAADNVNGNQALNFSNTDYAIINAVGENAGGDGVTPTRNIPSGQGFFVAMSNNAPATLVSGDVYTTNIIFSNSMRVATNTANSQFFKKNNSKSDSSNKLWLNLVSDNGIFNQVLIGYVNGATDGDDGIAYDAVKFPKNGSSIYTTIPNVNKKFAIQGKASNSLDTDEVVKLGFKTSIDVATIYTLSIAQLQGDFLSNNSIYLKDNLTNTVHNLSDSDYSFTSDAGEFNERFEIVFSAAALSNDAFVLDANTIKIMQLDNETIQFTTEVSNFTSISIFDLLGRNLYDLKSETNTETYNLSSLKSSVYIATIELANGATVSKKFVKK